MSSRSLRLASQPHVSPPEAESTSFTEPPAKRAKKAPSSTSKDSTGKANTPKDTEPRKVPSSPSKETTDKADTTKHIETKQTTISPSQTPAIPVSPETTPQTDRPTNLQVNEEIGDFFAAPPNTLLIHACNCEGRWGAGIAKAFRTIYPKAYEEYADRCDELGHDLLAHGQLIGPVDHTATKDDKNPVPKHFVGCLYTSRGSGKTVDSPEAILGATGPAMDDLLAQAKAWNNKVESDDERVKYVRMCKINSGLFAVPWENTKAVVEKIEGGQYGFTNVEVVSPN